jgi:sulfite exporter TauE/SafE
MMWWMEGFVIGLMGSLHCVGMCGPIALALPLREDTRFTRLLSALLYNLGRVFTYSIMGLVLGFIGQNLMIWGWQRWASIGMGSIMVLSIILPILFSRLPRLAIPSQLTQWIQKPFGFLFSQRTFWAIGLIGMLNGLLPCGLVYIALAGALTSGFPAEGALYMAAFGLGTLPMLFALNVAKTMFPSRFRIRLGRIIPWLVLFFGLLFILRGLNLGIPYISPKMEKPGCAKCCHS